MTVAQRFYQEIGALPEQLFAPHLSTARGQVIQGEKIYFARVHKEPGKGSEPHYHPNEQFAFPLSGRINGLVGSERRLVSPGTLIHIPVLAQHQIKATEDGPMSYLYIKDTSWTVVGVDVKDGLPEVAPTVEQELEEVRSGTGPRAAKGTGASQARVSGLGNCFYPMLTGADLGLRCSAGLDLWVHGLRMSLGVVDRPADAEVPDETAADETFAYVLDGRLVARVDGERGEITAGGIVHVPRGARFSLAGTGGTGVRLVVVRYTGKD